MDFYLNFIYAHWPIVGLFVFLVVALVINEMRADGHIGGVQAADPEEVVQLINRQNANIIDIRPQESYKAGSIAGAHNIPLAHADKRLSSYKKSKSKPIVVVCAAGKEAGLFCKKLSELGFENVTLLRGGIEAWQRADMPLIKNG